MKGVRLCRESKTSKNGNYSSERTAEDNITPSAGNADTPVSKATEP